jgi:cofilin
LSWWANVCFQSSGVGVNDAAIQLYQEMKLKKNIRYAIYKLNDTNTEIGVDKSVPEGDYDSFVAALPPNDCRYAIYDFVYDTPEGQRNKLLFYVWFGLEICLFY